MSRSAVVSFTGMLLLSAVTSLTARNKPVLGTMPDDTILVSAGRYFCVIPGVDDGDAGVNQNITITATSSNTSVLTVDSVQYTAGNTCAVVYVTEKGTTGFADLAITATDPDGTATGTMKVMVAPLSNSGVKFEAHDAMFWQEVVPLKNKPVYSQVFQKTSITFTELDFSKIPLTVNMDCPTKPPCTGYDFYTQFFRGFLIPPATGPYTFYIKGVDGKALWLSSNDKVDSAKTIIRKSRAVSAGTDLGNDEMSSAAVTLTAGKIYAFYATHWVIHTQDFTISWSGPGIEKSVITGAHSVFDYSPGVPAAPKKLAVLTRGNDFFRIGWNRGSVTTAPSKYCIYVNGIRKQTTADTFATLTGLAPNSAYSIFVTAADVMGKESYPGAIVNSSTYAVDNTAPVPPQQITDITVSDLAVKIRWSGAKDKETAVTGYNVYLNGILYNSAAPVYENSCIVRNLKPSTVYSIQVTAIDAGKNESAKSAAHQVTTIAFNVTAPDLGMKKAAVTCSRRAIANATGFGINANYMGSDMYTGNTRTLLNDLKPSLNRWGALPANPMSLAACSGAGKAQTYAKFLKNCNDKNILCAITTGVSSSTDWRRDPQTFANFIEYLNGPSSTTWGAIRAQEGIADPLFPKCKGLIIELGNEVWGASAHNADIGADYAVYGQWCRQVTAIMKKSPYFDSTKVRISYSGRNPSWTDSYGLHDKLLTGDSGQVDMVAVMGYLGGNLNYDAAIAPGKNESEYYKDGFFRMYENIYGLKWTEDKIKVMCGNYKPTFFYESNMTTTPYYGRLGQAVTMTDYMATAMEWGSVAPCIYGLVGNEWQIVRAGKNNKKLPLYLSAQLYNRFCRGMVLSCPVASRASLVNAVGTKFPLEPIGSHFYTSGDTFTILLMSRDFENDFVTQLHFEVSVPANTVARKFVMSGSDFSTCDATIDSSELPLTNGMLVTVPKYGIVLITFKAASLNLQPLPFGCFDPTRKIGVGVREPVTPGKKRQFIR